MLPGWLQPVAWCLPSAYVFEGMRSLLVDKQFRGDLMLEAAGLNLVYIAIGILIYLGVFRMARRHGLLMQQGE